MTGFDLIAPNGNRVGSPQCSYLPRNTHFVAGNHVETSGASRSTREALKSGLKKSHTLSSDGGDSCFSESAGSYIMDNSRTSLEIPDEYFGQYLEDFDRPGNQTFLVLSNRIGKVYVYRFNKAKSLWIFGPKNPFRKFSVLLITNQFFEFFIILTILVNCILLAIDDVMDEAEYVFTSIYTAEMMLKIISKGLVLHRFAYLRDPWNWLDFIVVLLGYITLTPNVANLTGIRIFRVLRALRTISAIEGLKIMVNALLKSMRLLSDVLILTTFFICVFALVGMQLFNGQLRNKCVLNFHVAENLTWRSHVTNKSNWLYIDGVHVVCGNSSTARRCPLNYTCLPDIGQNPNYGFTSFDNFGWSLLTSLQLVTLDYWENMYFHITSAVGSWYIFFFMSVIFFGSFYLINLVLAVVAVSYQQETDNLGDQERYYSHLREIASSYSLHGKIVPKLLYDIPKPKTFGPIPSSLKSGAGVVVLNGLSKEDIEFSRMKSQDSYNTPRHDKYLQRSLSKNMGVPDQVSEERADSQTGNNRSAAAGFRLPDHHMVWEGTSPAREKVMLSKGKAIQAKFLMLTSNPLFEFAVTTFICLNTIFLSIEYHDMNPIFKKLLTILNHVFTLVFFTEMMMKLIALTPKGYLKSRWNIFDGLVVIISVIDLIMELASVKESVGLGILRTFRLLRVLKLAKSWSTMRMLLNAIGRSVGAIGNLTLILGIIVYMLAVVGVQLFGDQYKAYKFPDGEVPRWNFSNFGHSFMMIFRILCGEWIEPLYDCMIATGPWSVSFFVFALVVGNFLVLNLFLALLLSSFAEQAIEEEIKKRKSSRMARWRSGVKRLQSVFKIQKSTKKINPETNGDAGNSSKQIANRLTSKSAWQIRNAKSFSPGTINLKPAAVDAPSVQQNSNGMSMSSVVEAFVGPPTLKSSPKAQVASSSWPWPCICKWVTRSSRGRRLIYKWHNFCMKVKAMVEHRWFDNGILVLILASSAILVFEDIHLPTRPKLQLALEILNTIFCAIFSLEFMLKIIAWGFGAYLRNPWNWLDMIIVAISIASVIGTYTDTHGHLSSFRSIRTLRALRPLRAISKWEGIKIVVNSLLQAIPSIGNVLLVCVVFWLIFSIMGVQFFGGKFYKCIDDTGDIIAASLVPNKTICLERGFYWRNSNVNFDNSLNGFLALFQVATFEGWMEVMKDAVDSAGIDRQPENENNFTAYLYFVVFIIIGSFFILNLFISVIIDNFYRLKKQYDDCGAMDIFLTYQQRRWFTTLKKLVSKKPKKSLYRPQAKWQAFLFDIVHSTIFESIITVLILLNMASMMISYHDEPQDVTTALKYLNITFTVIFTIEVMVRLLALRKQYFRSGWNIFDFAVVILSIGGICLELFNVNMIISPSVLRVMRVMRIGRLLRYFKAAKGIRRLLVALVISLPALFNIGALLFLILFIYAVVGMSAFGNIVKHGALNELVNFETFGSSMLVLFRLSTSAGWNDILDALMVQPPDCDMGYRELPTGNCGIPWLAVIYMVSFILFTFMIIVNMYIAVILENFNQAHQEEEVGIRDDDLEMFYHHWQKYDPDATQYILYSQLSDFVEELDPPFRIPKPNRLACSSLNIPIKDGDRIHCIDVVQALVRQSVGFIDNTDTEYFKIMSERMEDQLGSAFPSRVKDTTLTTTLERMREIRAAVIIQRHFQQWRQAKLHSLKAGITVSNPNVETADSSVKPGPTPIIVAAADCNETVIVNVAVNSSGS